MHGFTVPLHHGIRIPWPPRRWPSTFPVHPVFDNILTGNISAEHGPTELREQAALGCRCWCSCSRRPLYSSADAGGVGAAAGVDIAVYGVPEL